MDSDSEAHPVRHIDSPFKIVNYHASSGSAFHDVSANTSSSRRNDPVFGVALNEAMVTDLFN